MAFGPHFGSFGDTLGSICVVWEGLGNMLEIHRFLKDSLADPRLRQVRPEVVSSRFLAALTNHPVGL